MRKIAITACLTLCLTESLTAGPFGLRRGNYAPANGNQGTVYAGNQDGELYSAQGVANRIARTGIFRHWGNPSGGYEGIGIGGSPEAARRNCCYASRFSARDVGYAQMASGMWVACQRY